MSTQHQVRSFEYVNRPYLQVRDAIAADPASFLQHGSRAATERAGALAVTLRAKGAGLEIGVEIAAHLLSIQEITDGPEPVTVLHLDWAATRAPGLFPTMEADLRIYPLTATETQLELRGHYHPPLGMLGGALDALVLHRVVEASMKRLVEDLSTRLMAPPAGDRALG